MHTLEELRSGSLKGVKRLRLSCGLTQFPKEIFDLAETLEILDLSGNLLSELPFDFGRLQKLRIAFFSDNLFTTFPEVLAECPQLDMIGFKANKISSIPEAALTPQLRWLILTNNVLTHLPKSIGTCVRMQKLMLAGNLLKELPQEMCNCCNLELLRLSANQFEKWPDWLFEMPKLSWLALAGNPGSIPVKSAYELEEVPWELLQIGDKIGEGASGIIYKADRLGQEVAVKIFKGEVTSDGLPQDEMSACIAAGSHPNLVRVVGCVKGHPEQKSGLVFALIPSGYTNLGGPPSFESCTRDVFEEGTTFSEESVVRTAKGVASVLDQLHRSGIVHGDLYAHNTLVDHNGDPLFGDFGAAYAYDKKGAHANLLERIEVRAYGCFLDDLLTHSKGEGAARLVLQEVRTACLDTLVEARPSFSTICDRLAILTTKRDAF